MKKNPVKRILSFVLAAIMLCSVFATTAAAATKCSCGHSPVIMISGFGATALAEVQEDGSLEKVFPPEILEILGLVGANGVDIIKGLVDYFQTNNGDTLAVPMKKIITEFLEPLKMNDDGTSYYNLVPILSGAENTSLEAFTKNDQLDLVPYTGSEFLDMEVIGDEIGDDHVFNFLYDWRKSHTEVADELHEYIKEVCELTGHDKVSIYSISQGSLVLGVYMYNYPEDNYIDRAVFDTPLLEGSNLVSDAYSDEPMSMNYLTVLEILRAILHTEFDFSFLTEIISAEEMDKAVDLGAKTMIIPLVVNIPAFWEMCDSESYEYLKGVYLDEVKNEKLLAMIDETRSGFMSHISETLRAQQKKGVSVSIKSCTGVPLATGTNEYSDGIVNLRYSCGATCAPYGEKFADDYKQAVNTGKNNISPDRTVDLSTGYLPEHTWIVNNHYHGQAEWDPRTYSLLMELLLTDNIKDAYSHIEYPQFMESCAPTTDVALFFKSTNSSFLPVLSKHLFSCNSVMIKNLSNEDKIKISSVTSTNGTLKFNLPYPVVLEPGESIEVAFTGKVPATESYDTVTVGYRRMSLLGKDATLDFGYTVTNNYSGVTKADLTPAFVITAIQLANDLQNMMTQINAIIAFINGLM